jgi:hypothetical protein
MKRDQGCRRRVHSEWKAEHNQVPVILAIQQAEIRRIEVQSQHRQIVHKTQSQKIPNTKKGLVEWLKL